MGETSDEEFSVIIATLSKEKTDASEELVCLTELCQLLSFSDEDSVSDETSGALSPLLVKLASEKMIPDIALLAVRAMTYLCDLSPHSPLFLVRDDAVSVLCKKLLNIEDIDTAEQCLRALEKISEVQPSACCRAGAIMAVLKFLDFFSTTGQRLALNVVMNICSGLPLESMPAAPFMESVPILINLLYQREDDPFILKMMTVSLIGISRGVGNSPAMVAKLCEHGFIPATFHVLVHSVLSDSTCKLLLRAYARLSRTSFEAYQAFFELDIAGVVKDNFAASSGRCRATLDLIDALLSSSSNKDYQLRLQKKNFLLQGLVENLGKEVVPLLADSGSADSYLSYSCLRIVKKLIRLCTSEFLIDLLKSVNISSFLAGAFTIEDPHVQLLALQTSELILEKLSSEFLTSFVKEGVFFSINALISQDKCVPEPSGSQAERVPCLCHSFDKSSQDCKLEKDSVKYFAQHMRSIYFSSNSSYSNRTLSGVFRELRDFSTKLTRMIRDDVLDQQHDNLLDQIFSTLNGSEPISTFEFVQSGIVKSLAEYLCDSSSLSLQKRFRVLVRLSVSSSEAMAALVHKLQNGLLALETSLDLKKCSSANDILHVLLYLDKINSSVFDLISEIRIEDFANGKLEDLDSLKISVESVPQIEFLSAKLTKRLQQEMSDSIPAWCKGLMVSYPFLFGFGVRRKFFQLDAFGDLEQQFPSEKFIVSRDRILKSASHMMELFSWDDKVSVEVEFKGEIGTGNGPTREFYTLLSHELQDAGTGMWREDSLGLFPRPLNEIKFVSQEMGKFVLLGRTVARALREGRVLDMRFSKAFYKLILGKKLGVFDVLSFDPAFGRTLIEFTALVGRKEYLESAGLECKTLFRGMRIEDLCLDFTLPGYPDFVLGSGLEEEDVTMQNLKEYVSSVLDATIGSGISSQVKGFEYGFNQLFPMKKLEVFTEEELERLLCGESECWSVDDLVDQVKFDHGYTATCPPMVDLMEIIAEFDERERRAFLQFVSGAPRLPLGGFGSLNPKLTIVRKDSVEELPSVMTCVHYLKMPPYSSKQVMRQKLLYAITEGQGSFQFS